MQIKESRERTAATVRRGSENDDRHGRLLAHQHAHVLVKGIDETFVLFSIKTGEKL